jgi:signal transduction histidine kinase
MTHVMDTAVSCAPGELRIQTTPEKDANDRGIGGGQPTVPPRTYRTWAVFTLALSLLLALMLVPAMTALRRSEGIYEEIRANQRQFQVGQRVFEDLSQNVFTISITIREFLLDNSPDAGQVYRSRLAAARTQLQDDIDRLRAILPPSEHGILARLEREVDGYVALVGSVFEWTPAERAQRAAYFLREEQRPRRQAILAVADEVAALNASLYEQQQLRTTASETRFRSDLLRSVLFAVIAGITVSAAGILRMRWLERRAHEQHQHVEQTSEEIRHLSARLRQAQEEERRTLSRELHDDVGQKLTALRMELGSFERLRTTDDPEFRTALADVKGLAEQSLRIVRDIAAGLRPSVLDDLGLGPAVHRQAREFSKRTGAPVSVSVEGDFASLDDRQRIYLYRIVQEALTNCAKHANARQIVVALLDRDRRIDLTVSDDGAGFARGDAAHTGVGLIGIEERVRELGGTIAVQSVPGRGTTLRVSIPHQ